MNAVDRLRSESDESICMIGESPRQDWELRFRVHPKVAELQEYAPFIAAKNELTALQYPHIAEHLIPEEEMGLTDKEHLELRRLGNIAYNATGYGDVRPDLAPELRCCGWAPIEPVNPFFDRLQYEYRLVASGGLATLPDSISDPGQIRLATPCGVLSPLEELGVEQGRVNISSVLWTDMERRIAYRVYDNNLVGWRLEFVVDHWIQDED